MRIKWIDVAKGIGIFYVLLSHSGIGLLGDHVSSFYIMFFFSLSGLTFNLDKYKTFREFSLRKFKALITPYLIISFVLFLIYIFHIIFEFVINGVQINKLQIIYQIIGVIYGKSYIFPDYQINFNNIFNGPLWFLPAIFVSEILFYFILRSKKNLFIKVVFLSILGYLLPFFINFYLPWSLDIALVGISFIYLGYLVKSLNLTALFIFFILILLNITAFALNGKFVNVAIESYGNFFFFIMGSVSGTLIYMIISIYLARVNLLSDYFAFIGRNTITFLGFHLLIFNILASTVLKNLADGTLFSGFIFTTATCIILFFFINIFKKLKRIRFILI